MQKTQKYINEAQFRPNILRGIKCYAAEARIGSGPTTRPRYYNAKKKRTLGVLGWWLSTPIKKFANLVHHSEFRS